MYLPPDTVQASKQNGVWVVNFGISSRSRIITLFSYYAGPVGGTVAAQLGTTVLMVLTRSDTSGWEFVNPLPLPAGQQLALVWNSGVGAAGPIATLYTALETAHARY
ncbi:hypothetical protein ACPCTO_03180 [Streptomyces olivoreticuli]